MLESYYERNKASILAKAKVFRENNKEELTKYHRSYYLANRDLMLAKRREIRRRRRERLAEQLAARYGNITCLGGIILAYV